MDAAARAAPVPRARLQPQARSSRRLRRAGAGVLPRGTGRPHARLLHRPLSRAARLPAGHILPRHLRRDRERSRPAEPRRSRHRARGERIHLLTGHHREQREKRRQGIPHPVLQQIHALAPGDRRDRRRFARQSAPHSARQHRQRFPQARHGHHRVADTDHLHLAAHAVRGGRRQALLARPHFIQAGARRTEQKAVLHVQIPLHARKRPADDRLEHQLRPAQDEIRLVHPQILHRRAAAVLQRPQG